MADLFSAATSGTLNALKTGIARFILLACATLFLSGPAFAELPPNYKFYLQTENAVPFNFSLNGKNFAKEDKIDGVSTRVMREMMKRSGIRYTMTLRFPWSRIYDMTLERPNYGLFSTVKSDQRLPLFDWVGPLFQDKWYFMAMEGSNIKINSLEDAKKYKIGVYSGDIIQNYLQGNGFDDLVVSAQDNLNPDKLASGKIDLWATHLGGPKIAQNAGYDNIEIVNEFMTLPLNLAINKNTPPEVKERLQRALDEMKADGTFDQIIADFFASF